MDNDRPQKFSQVRPDSAGKLGVAHGSERALGALAKVM